MDHMDHVLSTYLRSKKFLPAIRSGITLAQETLNCYYSRTDQSEVYRIAMSKFLFFIFSHKLTYIIVLHPKHKLSYFKTACWEDEWITTAEQLVRDEFTNSYMNAEADSDANSVELIPDSNAKDTKV